MSLSLSLFLSSRPPPRSSPVASPLPSGTAPAATPAARAKIPTPTYTPGFYIYRYYRTAARKNIEVAHARVCILTYTVRAARCKHDGGGCRRRRSDRRGGVLLLLLLAASAVYTAPTCAIGMRGRYAPQRQPRG